MKEWFDVGVFVAVLGGIGVAVGIANLRKWWKEVKTKLDMGAVAYNTLIEMRKAQSIPAPPRPDNVVPFKKE